MMNYCDIFFFLFHFADSVYFEYRAYSCIFYMINFEINHMIRLGLVSPLWARNTNEFYLSNCHRIFEYFQIIKRLGSEV